MHSRNLGRETDLEVVIEKLPFAAPRSTELNLIRIVFGMGETSFTVVGEEGSDLPHLFVLHLDVHQGQTIYLANYSLLNK